MKVEADISAVHEVESLQAGSGITCYKGLWLKKSNELLVDGNVKYGLKHLCLLVFCYFGSICTVLWCSFSCLSTVVSLTLPFRPNYKKKKR